MKNKLRVFIENGEYELANQYLLNNISVNDYNDEVAVFDAAIGLYYQDDKRVWNACANGLALNPVNHELYVILGEYYFSQKNYNQMYLCYENALYHCKDKDDREQINSTIGMLKENYPITVRKVSIIILSYDLLQYTRNCIESIRNTTAEEVREIIVVDNGSKDGSVEWLRGQKDIRLIENAENIGFPKGCNQGIEAANSDHDIFLLNNDTLMLTNSLFWLRMGLYERQNIGSVGSISNNCGNLQRAERDKEYSFEEWMRYGWFKNVPMEYPYQEKLYLIGYALLIKREVVNKVGELDERFTPGNFEDNDYGLRILQEGYKNILCKNSFIFHYGSKSFKKDNEKYYNLLQINGEKFKEKWGLGVSYHFYPRRELGDWIKEETESAFNVLDIGCGCGALLTYIKGFYPNASIYGVEMVKKAAEIAGNIGNVICGNIETMDFPWEKSFFDYVILGDVLEHLHDPAEVLIKLKSYIKKGGHIIVSMPNMKHYSVMLPLIIEDKFTYEDAGILDRTHVKMYTGTEINRLIKQAGYEVEEVRYTLGEEADKAVKEVIDILLEIAGKTDPMPYLAYQYLFKAKLN